MFNLVVVSLTSARINDWVVPLTPVKSFSEKSLICYNILMDYSRFQAVYANIPEKIRNEVVAVIDDKPYSWNAAYVEISDDTTLGRKIYQKLIDMEII